MSAESVLLGLRLITGALLLAFMGAVLWALWRDFRAAEHVALAGTRRYGRLVIVAAGDGGPDTGTNFPLLPLTSLGRGPSNTIALDDTFCSQEHALVTRRGGQWWLEDRGSSNGTRLNDAPVQEPVVISSGDVIGVGQVDLRVELE
ncbi:MAG: FHA domain-containing protein [Anaerolineae bacterium]|nr:FHA domain-containing protein [Anaerolineae bacterium]